MRGDSVGPTARPPQLHPMCCDSWFWHSANALVVGSLWTLVAAGLGLLLFYYELDPPSGEQYLLYNAFVCSFWGCAQFLFFRSLQTAAACCGTPESPLCRPHSFVSQALAFANFFAGLVSLTSVMLFVGSVEARAKFAGGLPAGEDAVVIILPIASFVKNVLGFFFSIEQFADPRSGFCCFRVAPPADTELAALPAENLQKPSSASVASGSAESVPLFDSINLDTDSAAESEDGAAAPPPPKRLAKKAQ